MAQYAAAAGFPLYHADCYRLEQAATEALDIGLDELLLDDGVAIVEWAERIESLLPADHLRITLAVLEETRRELTFEPQALAPRRFLAMCWLISPENCQCSMVNGQLSMLRKRAACWRSVISK